MNNAGVPIAFLALAIWAASVMLGAPATVDETKPAPAAVAQHPPPESLFVSSATPTVVIVADLGSEFGLKWMNDSAPKLREKGWEVRSLSLEGSDEVRFYIRAQGIWRTHAGQMSLGGLKAILGT